MLDLVTLDCVIYGVGITIRMLPDSSVDAIIACEDVEKNASKLMSALTVSGKYQEIVSFSESSSEIAVDCKHIYSGIVVHLRVTRSCNTRSAYRASRGCTFASVTTCVTTTLLATQT